jgi:hypothetical protein
MKMQSEIKKAKRQYKVMLKLARDFRASKTLWEEWMDKAAFWRRIALMLSAKKAVAGRAA